MKGVSKIYEKFENTKILLLQEIENLREKLLELPIGELLCIRNGSYIKWYKKEGSVLNYISKNNRHYAQALAWRKYYQLQIDRKQKELQLIENYLNCYQKISVNPNSLFEDSSSYKELLTSDWNSLSKELLLSDPQVIPKELLLSDPQVIPKELLLSDPQVIPKELLLSNPHTLSNYLHQWASAAYEQNAHYSDNLIHKSLSGHFHRSKSEVIIANSLFLNHIPYRYECALHLDDVVLYPDFTILHPKTLDVYYWEHFGMMDNHSYCDKTFQKLKLLGNHGIIPSINLITTYETQKHPIDSSKIQQIVREWFV